MSRRTRRRRGHVRPPAVLLAVGAAGVAAVVLAVLWPLVDGQARAAVVLTSVLEVPVASPAARALTEEPRVVETTVAGNPTIVYVPAGEGPYPAVVFVNGAVLEGRRLPEVRRLGEGLARAGYLTVVPDLPGLTSDEITPTTLSATIDVALAVSDRPDARGGKVGLVGGSTGATLAILAAEDPRLAGRVRAVSGIAPYADIKTVLSIATTGHYELDGEIVPYQAEPFLSYVVARSVISALPPGEDREKLLREIRQVPRDSPDPLASLRARRTGDLGPEARSVVDLLGNRDSGRFVRLYRQLPEETRRSPERLSPVAGAGRLLTPVEVVTGPRDRYFPASESYELERVAPRRVVTVTGVLAHYMPRVSARTLPEFVELNNYAVRSLRNMRAPDGGAGG